ncbi:MAG: hypothetical protein EPO39_19605 [Candidatus Manganitrophaceae bacterium]|nr:MAG: hypothetical protein EPO39_19605 [Candidatus Manganitrophaceae bacterium]
MKPTRIRRQIGPFLLNIYFMLLVFGGCGGETSIGVGGGSCVGATCQTGGNGGGGASPDAPILSIAAGDGENTLTLAPPAGSGATNFNVYWSTSHHDRDGNQDRQRHEPVRSHRLNQRHLDFLYRDGGLGQQPELPLTGLRGNAGEVDGVVKCLHPLPLRPAPSGPRQPHGGL